MQGVMAIQAIEMGEMAFQKKLVLQRNCRIQAMFQSSKKSLTTFSEVDFFSEGHFNHFYGSHGHKTTHHSKRNWINLYLVFFFTLV